MVNHPNRSKTPRSMAIAAAGITTRSQYAKLMTELIRDLVKGSITPRTANAICRAAGEPEDYAA